MQLAFILNNYGHLFYLVGQSTYTPLIKSHHWNIKSLPLHYYRYIGAYFAVVAVLTIAGVSLELRALLLGDEKATPQLAITIALTACSNFAAIFQCKFYPDSLDKLHHLFFQVDFLFRKNLRRTFSYQSYRLNYSIKSIVCIFLGVINLIVVITLNAINDKELVITSIEMTLKCISVLVNLHAVFYIGLHVCNQENFCKIIDSVSSANNARSEQREDVLLVHLLNCRQIMTNIQIFKIIHFKLWKASQMISQHFGWTIILWYLQNFLDMTNSAFYLYIFVQNGHFALGILRTYNF